MITLDLSSLRLQRYLEGHMKETAVDMSDYCENDQHKTCHAYGAKRIVERTPSMIVHRDCLCSCHKRDNPDDE